MAQRGYLEGQTKETIGGHHLVPRALVPRTEVTPMPGVRGGGRGDVREKGVSEPAQFVCWGKKGKSLGGGRSKSPIQFSARPREEGV